MRSNTGTKIAVVISVAAVAFFFFGVLSSGVLGMIGR